MGRFLNADALVATGQGALGNNMFVYCLNNPVCRMDRGGTCSGILEHEDFGQASAKGGGGSIGIIFPIIIPVPSQPEYELTATEIAAMEAVIAQKQEKAKEEAIVIAGTVTASQETAVYYGIDFYGGTMNCITGPMTFWAADAWATMIVASGTYNDRQSWGLYTQNIDDAASMAVYLGCPTAMLPDYILLTPDLPTKGWHYPHFHTEGRRIHGKPAEGFHIWYGNAGG